MGLAMPLMAQENYEAAPENLEAREWFEDAKFGMFIHWGIYSVLGDGEWVMNNQKIQVEDYEKLADFFNPQEFDAEEWVSLAKEAGMKYITITSRHHDSFSMFDTEASEFNIVDATPYGQDILAQLAEECEKQGIKLFFYYSQLDWRRENYYPRGRTGHDLGLPDEGNWDEYIEFMKTQLTELMTNYGEVGGIWFDGHWDHVDWDGENWGKLNVDWHYDELYPLIHNLQPAALIANNHHIDPLPGEDFQAFERTLPGEKHDGWGGPDPSALPLESARTMNGSWGFNLQDTNYKSFEELIDMLVKSAGFNSNLLLNIGPMPNGKIQPEFLERLKQMGEWTDRYGETIYGTRGGIVPPQDWGVTTQKGDRHFMHILDAEEELILIPGFPATIESAVYFDSGEAAEFKQIEEGVFIYLDEDQIIEPDTIIEFRIE
jgi:alpha-L-fucosidase